MNDLITRLRTHDDARLYREADVLMSEAADRIEKLEAQLAAPADPTDAMIEAGARYGVDGDFDADLSNGIKDRLRTLAAGMYRAMLDAAPQPAPGERQPVAWMVYFVRPGMASEDKLVVYQRDHAEKEVMASLIRRVMPLYE